MIGFLSFYQCMNQILEDLFIIIHYKFDLFIYFITRVGLLGVNRISFTWHISLTPYADI